MRAMIHLGVFRFFQATLSKAGSGETLSAARDASNRLWRLANLPVTAIRRKLSVDFIDHPVRQSRHARVKKPPHYSTNL
jgi:hypothetical protein